MQDFFPFSLFCLILPSCCDIVQYKTKLKGNAMSQTVLGIDTGGTYTDAVLLDPSDVRVIAKAKSPTTREHLETCIMKSIEGLAINDPSVIDKVVLSTTLATNAIVEGEGRPTGLIIIGAPPKGELPTKFAAQIDGKVNIKGRIVEPVKSEQAEEAVKKIMSKVSAFAVSGMMSTRNAGLELQVKKIIEFITDMPVVCGHELSSQLGFHDRTVTTVLNASLIPIIREFTDSVRKALNGVGIDAPVYIVKGDGSLAVLDFIREKPIETILSGPASSMIGALALAKVKDGIVVDMGGTTTDSGIIENNTLALSPIGAKVGRWQTQVDSAKLFTFGLGGDTSIVPKDGAPFLTEKRTLPSCRRKDAFSGVLTPTDLLHATGDLSIWNRKNAENSIKKQAEFCNIDSESYKEKAVDLVLNTIKTKAIDLYSSASNDIPVIAIGAPVKPWYGKIAERVRRPVIIPENYEVANAVGAAMASVEERVEGLVHLDEENDGYAGHLNGETFFFKNKEEAVDFISEKAKALCKSRAEQQGVENPVLRVETEEITRKVNWVDHYVKTIIRASARASSLHH